MKKLDMQKLDPDGFHEHESGLLVPNWEKSGSGLYLPFDPTKDSVRSVWKRPIERTATRRGWFVFENPSGLPAPPMSTTTSRRCISMGTRVPETRCSACGQGLPHFRAQPPGQANFRSEYQQVPPPLEDPPPPRGDPPPPMEGPRLLEFLEGRLGKPYEEE